MPTPIDAVTAMLQTLKAHLDAALPVAIAELSGAAPVGVVAYVMAGWPAVEEELHYPTVALNAPTGGERVSTSPALVKRADPSDPQEAGFDAFYAVASLSAPILADVFAKSTTERGLVVRALEVALQVGVLESRGILRLVAPGYYDQEIAFWREGTARFGDTPDRIGADEWHAQVPLQAEATEIVPAKGTRLLRLDMRTCVNFVLPAEERTVFAPPPPP